MKIICYIKTMVKYLLKLMNNIFKIMEGPIKQLYEKDGAEFKPIRACDCENQGDNGGNGGNNDNDNNGGGNGGGDNNGGGGGLPTNISAVASAYESNTVQADASVNASTGVFTFKFGLVRGKDGKDGRDGRDGDTPVAHRSVMVFKTYQPTASKPEPDYPSGGSWDVVTDTIFYPSGWGNTDNIQKPVWMSTGEFTSVSPNSPKWSKPICISGEDGSDGTDGVSREFIYKRTRTDLDVPETPPSVNVTDKVPEEYGWSDRPQGIDEKEYHVEWVCTRKKDEQGNWGPWTEPAIWSKWGANGKDGDGVEYIYKRNNGEVLANPTPADTSTDEYQGKGDYLNKEYVPTHLGWSDEPKGVSSSYTHEWVCVRKQKDGVWQQFSNPALWSNYGAPGDNGVNGISIRTMYAKTSGTDDIPSFVKTNINPGSNWSIAIPRFDSDEALWYITAYVTYDNKLAHFQLDDATIVHGWQGPIIANGVEGKAGTPPNYKTTVFALSPSRPEKPKSDDPKNPGTSSNATGGTVTWVDYPNSIPTGELQWWQCTGLVNGVTDTIATDNNGDLCWGAVLNVNGKDGVAQDGKVYQMRFRTHSSNTITSPSVLLPDKDRKSVAPANWYLPADMPKVTSEKPYMWEIIALFNPDGTISGEWCDPFCITGEQGPQGETGPAGPIGPMGPNGISGIPGKDIEARYCLGTEDTYIATYNSNVANINDPTSYGWLKTVPSVTEDYPYIWCIQTSFVYERAGEDSESYVRNLEYPWSEPFRLSGVNGLPGERGKSQIIYPAGIYDNTTSYTADDDKAPYVFDTSDNNFYVLNYKGTWLGTQQDNRTPSQDYAENNGKYWMLMQSFDAIYANIGVFGNALVGSAVFNGDYMFSQSGINKNGGTSSSYQYFCDKNSSDPFDEDNTFRPNWCVNLRTGEQWIGAGNIYFDAGGNATFGENKINVDGTGQIANGDIKWNNSEIIIGDRSKYSSSVKINDYGLTVADVDVIHGEANLITDIDNVEIAKDCIIISHKKVGGVESQVIITADGITQYTKILGETITTVWPGESSDEGGTSGGGNIEFVEEIPANPKEGVLYVFI